jgi:hypothetical protein
MKAASRTAYIFGFDGVETQHLLNIGQTGPVVRLETP